MKPSKRQFFQIGARDINEPQITAVLDRCNLLYKLLPPGFGADILIFDFMCFVEVKNPLRPPSKRKLTKDELELQMFCEDTNVNYYVVEHPERMMEIVNEERRVR